MALSNNPKHSSGEVPKVSSQPKEALSGKDKHEALLQDTLTEYRKQYAELSDSVKAEQLVKDNIDTSGHENAAELAESALGKSLSWTQRREARVNTQQFLNQKPEAFSKNTEDEMKKRGFGGQYSPDLAA